MGHLFDRFDVEPVKGKDITIEDCDCQLFVSETDSVFYYPGMCLYDEDRRGRISFMRPYYLREKHSTDDIVTQEVKGFYRIIDGCFVLDQYVDGRYYGDRLYKKLNCGVRFACPASCDYGVFVNREEDKELTRKIFGLTYYELTDLLDAYAKMMGTNHDYFTYPKLTRSIKNTNFCDITEYWIPETFPYIAFNESMYDFSHVSLFGFYRYIQLLTGRKLNSLISQLLMREGLEEEILKKTFDIGKRSFNQTKVTRDIVW